jgi:hypothetical protein
MNDSITWKIKCKRSPSEIYTLLTTNRGRKLFWAESAKESEGIISFKFPNGMTYNSRVLQKIKNKTFELEYFHSIVKFVLEELPGGGTILTLINFKVKPEDYMEMYAGWISVLLSLKAMADFGIDLRNHQSEYSWEEKFVDN